MFNPERWRGAENPLHIEDRPLASEDPSRTGMSESGRHILIVEDDPVTRLKLAKYFAAEGFRVSQAGDGAGMRRILDRDPASILMIDVNLPGEDGFRLTREQRERSDVGIILVTGRDEPIDRIVGLEIGADDYVTKPFEPRELLARVKNLIARIERGKSAAADTGDIAFAGWRLDLGRRLLSDPQDLPVELTRAEFKLLALLARHPGQIFSRDQILREIANREWDAADRTADVLVRRLRRKLGDDGRNPRIILTSHSEGYYLSSAASSSG